MLAAGVIDRVEAGDRAAHASHLECQKYADRLGRVAHDVVDEIVKSEGHGGLHSDRRLAHPALVSLLERKLADGSEPASFWARAEGRASE
jgi:hypothetical protein